MVFDSFCSGGRFRVRMSSVSCKPRFAGEPRVSANGIGSLRKRGFAPLILSTRWRVKAHHLAGIELVFGLDHKQLTGLLGRAHDFAVRQNVLGALTDVLNCGFDQVVGFGARVVVDEVMPFFFLMNLERRL